jgi:hypothetical protein
VGFFSFLKKNDDAQQARPAAPALADPADGHGPATRMSLETEAERERQREIARATAAKIDEIELAMTSDIFADDAWGIGLRAPAAAAAAVPMSADETDSGFTGDDMPEAAVAPSSAPAVEEAAIMYANDQLDVATLVLLASLQETGGAERMTWWMLFDLYQVMGLENEFESIAIDYASHFETSPPATRPPPPHRRGRAEASAAEQFSGTVPTLGLSGRLDESIAARLARLLAPSSSPLVRLEFQAVSGATPARLRHAAARPAIPAQGRTRAGTGGGRRTGRGAAPDAGHRRPRRQPGALAPAARTAAADRARKGFRGNRDGLLRHLRSVAAIVRDAGPCGRERARHRRARAATASCCRPSSAAIVRRCSTRSPCMRRAIMRWCSTARAWCASTTPARTPWPSSCARWPRTGAKSRCAT